MFGFFNIGLPSVTILGVAAFGPTIWLPLVSVVPGVIGGIILWLWKRRATRGRAFPVLPVSQSQNDRP
jgi:uncharacterized oligopeptide transporter (OPT) family protein